MLVCPVRACDLALSRESRRLVCANGHSFDIARSGYVNLLQPQDRRSKQPGDSAEAVAARRRIYDRGVAVDALNALDRLAHPTPSDSVLEAGCGEGYYLGSLRDRHAFTATGIDISIPAIDAAARRYPTCQWLVVNADRTLPFADKSFTLALSITGRMNPAELRRILAADGRLVVAVPAPQDLVELRKGEERDRVERTVKDFVQEARFELVTHRRVSTTVPLSADAVADVRNAIYRPAPGTQLPQSLTFALDFLLFR